MLRLVEHWQSLFFGDPCYFLGRSLYFLALFGVECFDSFLCVCGLVSLELLARCWCEVCMTRFILSMDLDSGSKINRIEQVRTIKKGHDKILHCFVSLAQFSRSIT